jgi:aminoglycoside 6'-N-acetyltransferase
MQPLEPITFRPLTRDDFPLLARWLAEPLVARWWNHETSPEALERDFGATVDGAEAAEVFVALLGDRPFGLIQRYPIAAYADDLHELLAICDVPPGAISIDYLIGEPDLRGRGIGTAMIAAFLDETGADEVIVPVSVGNRASWRALERAGFERIAEGELEPDNPIDPRDHYILRRAGASR